MILFISYSGLYGGAERQLVDLAGSLPDSLAGERCLACPRGELGAAAQAAGMRVFPLRQRSLHVRLSARDRLFSAPRLLGHALEVRRLITTLAPDVVVGWGMRSASVCSAAVSGMKRRPAFVFGHNDLLPGPLIARAVRAAAAKADLIIAASHTVASELDPDGRLRLPIRVLHPGIDVESFADDEPPRTPPEVLVLGALVDWKRPDLALEAFSLVRRERPDARLVLAGATVERGEAVRTRLIERAARPDLAGSVELSGAISDPRQALRRATCLLHCAEREPFGLVVAEALASGRPAIVPAAAGPLEIVDGTGGLTYPPGDARAAAEALLEVLSDPQRAAEMGAAGRARARELFDRDRSRRVFIEMLAPLMPGRSRQFDGAQLAIVTVTHNSSRELSWLLDSLRRHLGEAPVVVVDNGSSDDSVTVARSAGAEVVPIDENIGFGRACNAGLARVRAPVTALLNPDIELLDDSLLALAREAARADAADRLFAPLVLNPDGSRQDTVHPVPSSTPELLTALLPPAALPGGLGLAIEPWRSDRSRPVGWAVGCALVARTDTLRKLGPFDERIFLYGEDMDLGLRASDQGVKTWFWPAGRVVHHRAHASSGAFGGEPFELLARARQDVVARRLGRRRARLDHAAQAVTFASRGLVKQLVGRSAARERAQLAALKAARGTTD